MYCIQIFALLKIILKIKLVRQKQVEWLTHNIMFFMAYKMANFSHQRSKTGDEKKCVKKPFRKYGCVFPEIKFIWLLLADSRADERDGPRGMRDGSPIPYQSVIWLDMALDPREIWNTGIYYKTILIVLRRNVVISFYLRALNTCGTRQQSANETSSPTQNLPADVDNNFSMARKPLVIQCCAHSFFFSSPTWMSTMRFCNGWMPDVITSQISRTLARLCTSCGNSGRCGRVSSK